MGYRVQISSLSYVIVDFISILNQEINDNGPTPTCFEVFMKFLSLERQNRVESTTKS